MLAFMLFMATFGLSSAWLFSPGPERLRNWWIANMGPLAALGYCQLCSAFWIGLGLHLFYIGTPYAVLCALGYAGASWFLGAITGAALWTKANCEKRFNYE